MPRYRKKPVVVEAFRLGFDEYPNWFYKKVLDRDIIAHIEGYIKIGTTKAILGDYIIRGLHGEVYPCKPDIFLATYEEVMEDGNLD